MAQIRIGRVSIILRPEWGTVNSDATTSSTLDSGLGFTNPYCFQYASTGLAAPTKDLSNLS